MIKIAKIFLIDDDIDVMMLFEQFLIIKGHKVIGKAYNGEEAIKIFKQFQIKPDVILMDHRMPLKNGLETTKEILKLDSDSNIIFVSADYTARNQAFKVGAVDFLEKPIDLDTLVSIIKKYSPIQNKIT
ncbi:MAG: response regulator [Candidatus Hermodarchaeota archaeon]